MSTLYRSHVALLIITDPPTCAAFLRLKEVRSGTYLGFLSYLSRFWHHGFGGLRGVRPGASLETLGYRMTLVELDPPTRFAPNLGFGDARATLKIQPLARALASSLVARATTRQVSVD